MNFEEQCNRYEPDKGLESQTGSPLASFVNSEESFTHSGAMFSYMQSDCNNICLECIRESAQIVLFLVDI